MTANDVGHWQRVNVSSSVDQLQTSVDQGVASQPVYSYVQQATNGIVLDQKVLIGLTLILGVVVGVTLILLLDKYKK
jgi:prophage tail gpP-like protein